MRSNFKLSELQKFLMLFQPKYALVLNEHDSSGYFQVKFGLHYWRGQIRISVFDPVKIGVVSGVAYLHAKARRNWGRKKSERFQLLPTPFIWLRSLKFVWKSDCRSGIRTLFSLENNHNTRHFWLLDERFIQPSYDSNSARIGWTNSFLLGPSSKMREAGKWPPAWLKARDGRGTKKGMSNSEISILIFDAFTCRVDCVWSLSVRYVFASKTVFTAWVWVPGLIVRLRSLALTRKSLRLLLCFVRPFFVVKELRWE